MRTPTALEVRQSEPVGLDGDDEGLLRDALLRLDRELRPTFSFVGDSGGRLVPQHLVGTVRLRDGRLVSLVPDVAGGVHWQRAVVDLLTSERLAVTGRRRSSIRRYPDLPAGLALAYAERLLRAFATDGPPTVYVGLEETLSTVRGRLRVTDYSRQAPWDRHRFPASFEELSLDNPFTQAMAFVAMRLSSAATDPATRTDLRSLARALRAGREPPLSVNPVVTTRRLPAQWRAFEPAWDIVRAVLSRGSLLRGTGTQHGLEVVVQTWPLLETLLRRVLNAARMLAQEGGWSVSIPAKGPRPFLRQVGGDMHRTAEPDGELTGPGGSAVATFEAKHSPGPGGRDEAWPPRSHRFQAVATAKARGAPLAVLVYPGDFPSLEWEVAGAGPPRRLVAVGIDMYSYVAGRGEASRARRILDVVRPGPPIV